LIRTAAAQARFRQKSSARLLFTMRLTMEKIGALWNGNLSQMKRRSIAPVQKFHQAAGSVEIEGPLQG
jgi:hypothetical protein